MIGRVLTPKHFAVSPLGEGEGSRAESRPPAWSVTGNKHRHRPIRRPLHSAEPARVDSSPIKSLVKTACLPALQPDRIYATSAGIIKCDA